MNKIKKKKKTVAVQKIRPEVGFGPFYDKCSFSFVILARLPGGVRFTDILPEYLPGIMAEKEPKEIWNKFHKQAMLYPNQLRERIFVKTSAETGKNWSAKACGRKNPSP